VRQLTDTPGIAQGDDALARAAPIGRYMVLGLVGRGAMGEVYAAYDPELDRKIAIKLLRVRSRNENASEGRKRLMREAQAIAKVSHPNVVTVYDVGTFQDQVFIAMQFVEGHTVGYWVHAEPRPWPDVLRVFVDAGRGLAAAHEKDLIHRDFKPDNVMVSTDGTVRVMDFGLARVVIGRGRAGAPQEDKRAPRSNPSAAVSEISEDSLAEDFDPESTRALSHGGTNSDVLSSTTTDDLRMNLTQAGALLGTPAYMSPEQFRGEETDAGSDQFSFCVALYEALYGERPFSGTTFAGFTANVLAGKVRDAPIGVDIPPWVRKILLRGLRVAPQERWPSMKALLAELEKNRAVARRRRFAAGAAAKLAGVWEAPIRGRPVETPAKTEMRRMFLATGKRYALDAFETASQILDRYTKSWSEMYLEVCLATHVREEQSAEVLDLRMASLQEGLDGLKALSRVFRQADGDVVENAVSAANALPDVDRSADIESLRAVVKPPEDPATRAAVTRLRAQLAEVRVFCRVGRLSDGLKAIVPLEEEARRSGYGPLLAEALFELGNLHLERRDSIAASLALEEAVWVAELCRHDEVAAKAATQLVYSVGENQLRFDAGEIWFRHAETLLRRLGGHDSLWGWLYNNRGAMRERQGRLADALEDARRAVVAKEKAGGPDDPDVAQSLGNIALCMAQLGELEQALPIALRAVRISEVGLGPEHPRTAIHLSNYGEILNGFGRLKEGREMAGRALSIFEGEVEADSVILSYPLAALGLGYLGEGFLDEALPILERVVAIRDAKEIEPSRLGEVHFALARALHARGQDLSRARVLANRARTEYSTAMLSPATLRELAAIDAWLAIDGGAPPRDSVGPSYGEIKILHT
jgi:eukaryotic-like serine/threonine-protein kinase